MSPKCPRIVFISSNIAASNFGQEANGNVSKIVPEDIVHDLSAASEIGYGQSKLVAERILEKAASEFEVPVSILRISQIAGSSEVQEKPWSRREWFPAMLETCRSLGKLLQDLPIKVDWIPVD